MQVGDFVRKKADTTYHKNLTGIIVEIDCNGVAFDFGATCKVAWGDYGTFWAPIIQLEVISGSR